MGEALVLMSNNATMVVYLTIEGGMIFLDICRLAQEIIAWSELHMVTISARCIPRKNILVDQLSFQDQVLLREWFLFPRMLDDICREFCCPLVSLLTTRADTKLLIYVSPISDPIAWKEDFNFFSTHGTM